MDGKQAEAVGFEAGVDDVPEVEAKPRVEVKPLTVAQLNKQVVAFEKLNQAHKDAEAKAKVLKGEKDAESKRLAELLIASGLTQHRHGGRLFSVRSKDAVYPIAGADSVDACKAIVAAKLGFLVKKTYNWQALQSAIKERFTKLKPGTPFEDAIPPKMRDLFDATSVAILVSTKSKT